MKKIVRVIFFILLYFNVSLAEENFILPLPNSINGHIKLGFNIVDVSASEQIVIYTLKKQKKVRVCYLIITTDQVLSCVTP